MSNPTAQQVITFARRFSGIKESPAGSNRQQFGVWYGMNGVAWCAIFTSYCMYVPGYRFLDATTTKGFAYCPFIVAWGQRHGRISRTPHIGDLAVWIHNGVASHVEIVTVPGSSQFTSIGGNTGPANLSNGGEVIEHSHPVGEWVFISPFYGSGSSPTPTPSPAPAQGQVRRNIALTTPLTTGADVKWAQGRLNVKGFSVGTPDGVYGRHTHDAVVAFQRSRGLRADGVLGPVTGDHLAA